MIRYRFDKVVGYRPPDLIIGETDLRDSGNTPNGKTWQPEYGSTVGLTNIVQWAQEVKDNNPVFYQYDYYPDYRPEDYSHSIRYYPCFSGTKTFFVAAYGPYQSLDDNEYVLPNAWIQSGRTNKIYSAFVLYNTEHQKGVYPVYTGADIYSNHATPGYSAGPIQNTFDEFYIFVQKDDDTINYTYGVLNILGWDKPMYGNFDTSTSSGYWSAAQNTARKNMTVNAYIAPNYPGDVTEPAGGNGTLVFETDVVEEPGLPSTLFGGDVLAVPYGMYIYEQDADGIAAIKELMKELLNPLNTLLIGDVTPYIISLRCMPFNATTLATDHILSSTTYYPRIGPLSLNAVGTPTAIKVPVIEQQFYSFDCGVIDLEYSYGNFLDYAPMSKLEIYLPFIGTKEIDVNDLFSRLNKGNSKHAKLHLKYVVDWFSGSCLAILGLHEGLSEERWIYSWPGKLAMDLPYNSADYSSMASGLVQLGGTVAGIATGGISAAAGAGMALTESINIAHAAGSAVKQNGSMSGVVGWFGVMTPYLVWTVPRASVPEEYNKHFGFPSNIEYTLSDLSGFTKILNWRFKRPAGMMDDEYNELLNMMRDGVIL